MTKLIHTLSLFSALSLSACSANVFESVASKSGDTYWLEEARVLIDDQDYSGALTSLNKVGSDTNDLRILRATARLGDSGLSLWDVLTNIVDSSSYSSSSGSGTSQVFDLISASVVGEGDVRTSRLEALTLAVSDLLSAPDATASRVSNLSCFLAGLMALPTVTDSTTAIEGTTQSLADIAATTDTSNTNATCPDTSALQTNLASIQSVQLRFDLIIQATKSCKFLDLTGTGSQLNSIETALTKFKSNADKGCSATPSCGGSAACNALGLSCVYTALTSDGSTSTAGDGAVSSCELVQNCLTSSTCF